MSESETQREEWLKRTGRLKCTLQTGFPLFSLEHREAFYLGSPLFSYPYDPFFIAAKVKPLDIGLLISVLPWILLTFRTPSPCHGL